MLKNNIIDEDDDEVLPQATNKKNDDILPPASKDKLISSGSRFSPERRRKEREEMEKKKEEQIYRKNKMEEEKKKEENNIQVEFMKPNGSLIFQTFVEFHQWYTILYFVIEELLLIYKRHYFHFPPYASEFEIVSLIFYLFVQIGRFYFGTMGNRSEASTFIFFCLLLSVGGAYTYIHYMLLQTFVLKIELITNMVGIVLWLFEVVFGALAYLNIGKKESGI